MPRKGPRARSTFDEKYYRRFYSGPDKVHAVEHIEILARGVLALSGWFGLRIERALDVGSGPGYWRDTLKKLRPDVKTRSTDASPFACAEFGHELRDISAWRADETFELVICQGVLQYLDDRACAAAIDNLGAMCSGLLYLEAMTKRDLRDTVDRRRTDLEVHERTGAWYRKRLGKHFEQVGAGLWAARGRFHFYELERVSPASS